MKISQKILLGFLFVFVLISLSGVPTSINYWRIIDAFRVMVDRDLLAIDLVEEMEKNVFECELALNHVVQVPKEESLKHFQEARKHWHVLRTQLREYLPQDDDSFEKLREIDRVTYNWFSNAEDILSGRSSSDGKLPRTRDIRPIYSSFLDLQRSRLSRSYEASVRTVEQSGELEWTLRVIALIIGLITCGIVIRSVRNPLIRLTRATQAISEGHFERVPPIANDELGQLTLAFNVMSESLQERTLALEEQRRLAIQASDLKTEFLANTSHELRTPLNTIIGYAQLILDGLARSREEELKYLATIQQSSKQLLSLINDVLDISRIEAGQMKLELEPVSVAQVFKHLEDHMRLPVQKKGLTFEVTMDPGVHLVMANVGRLNQVLLNLVGNSVKFTSSGSVKVNAKVVSNGKMVCFSVRDTGIGIPPSKQHRLFQKFVQADGSMTRSYGGTGLGLALSKTLLELMNGSIELFSEGEGKGATISFYLQNVEETKK